MKLWRSGILVGALLFQLSLLHGATLTNFFTGTINLSAGDISEFFVSGTTNPLPGVCVMLDTETAQPGAPGSIPEPSDGLNESPGSAGATKDMFIHPSGFNQRRIMSAYDPNRLGGVVYVGIDLPGGTGSAINRQFFNNSYGTVRVQGQVVPFDADGNGQADGIGLDRQGLMIPACPADDIDLDVWTCTDESSGATDNPRVTGTLDLSAREFYTVTIAFGDFTSVALDFDVTFTTLPGQADLHITQDAGKTFGALVSSDTGGTGVPQGFDVIFAVTNVNANVEPRSRLLQFVAVDSGSNRDGSGQGEDFNVLQCNYVLNEGLSITADCPPESVPPGGTLVVTGAVCNFGNAVLTGVVVTNAVAGIATNLALGPISLAPGECRGFASSNLIPASYNSCLVSQSITAYAQSLAGNAVSTNVNATCGVVVRNASVQAEKFCPSTPPALGEMMVTTGWICNDGEVTLTDIVLTNTAVGIITNYVAGPFTLAPGECTNYTSSYLVPTNFSSCFITDTIIATATDPCSGTRVSGASSRDCPLSLVGLTNCPPRCAEPTAFWILNLDQWPPAYAPTQTVKSVFGKSGSPGNRTLLEALNGTAGVGKTAELLKQGVTALLNAGNPSITYPFRVDDVVLAVSNALTTAITRVVTNTTALLQQANEEDICPPCVQVRKEIACLLPGNQCGAFGKMATGYRGDVAPAFCYSITISNCGAVALTNLTVIDTHFGDLSADFSSSLNGVLLPRKSVTRYYKIAWSETTTNVVDVSARSLGTDGGMVTAQDLAVAQVEGISLSCQALLTSTVDLDGNMADSHVLLPADGTPHPVRLAVIICNPGPLPLKNVTVDAGILKCIVTKPLKLAAGQCVTNEICVRPLNCIDVPMMPVFVVSGEPDVPDGSCVSDLEGKRVKISCQSSGLIKCRPLGTPGIAVIKRANKTITSIGGQVTYTYTVTNTAQATFTHIEVIDDNGTPDFTGDDSIAGGVTVLAAGESRDLTHTTYLPVRLCVDNTDEEAGTLITSVLTTGDIRVDLLESLTVNDNTFGTNAMGWGATGHSFTNLTTSDQAEFQFRNRAGEVLLQYRQDYLSPSSIELSGYGTLGVQGGDGAMFVGKPYRVLYTSSSLAENLNTIPFVNELPQYTVSSPALDDVLSPYWEYRVIYTTVVHKGTFGGNGFGRASLIDVHNSPAKRAPFEWTPCRSCVTNTARVTGHYGTGWLTNFATTFVCTTNEPLAVCAYPDEYWADIPNQWPRYAAAQTVESVFSEMSRYPKAAPRPLINAISGKLSPLKVSDLIREAVAALLNAEAMRSNFPLSRNDIVQAVNMALVNGSDASLLALTDLLREANGDGDCP